MISTLNENENGGKWRVREKKTNCSMNMNIESINEGNKTTFIVLNAIEKSTLFKHNVCIVFLKPHTNRTENGHSSIHTYKQLYVLVLVYT